MEIEFPYRVEYAKSNRSSCKVCKNPIAQSSLRIATVTQSPFHDGKLEKWHHSRCFFMKQRPKSISDIGHFDNIRWEDQAFIKKKIAEAGGEGGTSTPIAKGAKKRGKTTNSKSDFSVEYAKSNRSKCRGCENTIVKGEIRVGKKDYESEEARRYGGLDRWHHLNCFAQLRSELTFYDEGNTIPGADSLSKEDKTELKRTLPKIKREDVPPAAKKIKSDPEDAAEMKEMKSQNKKLFSLREHLDKLTKPQLVEMLEENDQLVPEGRSEILDHLSDVMIFGSLQPCTTCDGRFTFVSGIGYKCTGSVSEWVKCENVASDPKRTTFTVPSEIMDDHAFLNAYKCKVKKRVFKISVPSTSSVVKKEDSIDGPKIQGPPKPLKHLEFVIVGKTTRGKEELKKKILLLGGIVGTKITADTAAVISDRDEVEKMNIKMQEAQENEIDVVTEDFVDDAEDSLNSIPILIKKKAISTWGGDPSKRCLKSVTKKSAKSKSSYEKHMSGTVKRAVKGGGCVDPDSGLEDKAHVFQRGDEKFTITLGITDIQSGKNSYYKMQILKHDSKHRYWLFRSWGRIGTTCGGNKLEDMSLENCVAKFEEMYSQKTGNLWRNRKNFKKMPGCMQPLDVDSTEDDEVDSKLVVKSDISSKLKKPVQDLMSLIFDVSKMKEALLAFEIDIEKMPLGKISKKQIKEAYTILADLLNLLKSGNVVRTDLLEASNKFYTLVPHNFGISGPTMIDTEDEIRAKSEMLEALLDMEIAYSLLHGKTDQKKHPLDAHYDKLKNEIDVLDKESEEYKVIEKYVKNTHAETHRQYELEIEDVYTLKRSGESSKYKNYKKLGNKKLLWHGSRTTNYAGILSQGLRIAPPEAPVTGYMFGKGIYFADMVSKSANYCCASNDNPTGLLLLCEVALGETYDKLQADYIENLPKGKNSVWGKGKTMPDPEKSFKTKAGVEVPCGPAISVELPKKSSLLYNEFIVYDVDQVKMEYLVKTNFKYKY